jgi:hypothetical protein
MKPTAMLAVRSGSRLQAALSCVSTLLALGNLISIPARAQAPPVLNIVIVEGEGAINNVKQRVNRDPIVQVEDENHRPIAGAAVVFFLPDQGASGTFVNASRTLTVTTNAQGRAVATGIRPNNINGPMQIRVTASYQGQTASSVINQTNVNGGAGGSGGSGGAAAGGGLSTGAKVAIILLIVGGAAAGGIVAATHGGGGSNSSSGSGSGAGAAIGISAGTPSVGAPKQ